MTVLRGDGKLYWNGGMRRAFAAAIAGDYDYCLWMNDDTTLDDGALALLLETERQVRGRGNDAVIVAGAIRPRKRGSSPTAGWFGPTAGSRSVGSVWSRVTCRASARQ